MPSEMQNMALNYKLLMHVCEYIAANKTQTTTKLVLHEDVICITLLMFSEMTA